MSRLSSPEPSASDLSALSIGEAVRGLRERRFSAVRVVEAALERIERLDPQLHAWVTVDRQAALAHAQALDRELPQGGPRGPLHGIPVGIKDLFDAVGMATTACSPLLSDVVPREDADGVRALKQAGAVVLGKTVCPELALNDPPPTRNPWNAAHTPGGSSSGSAVAVATRMCAATLDTQTAGDILRPSAYNGVVGLKPTFGAISRRGVIPVAWSFDTVGVMARSVEDVATLYAALAGPAGMPTPAPVRPPRLGVVRGYFDEHAEPGMREHLDTIVRRLEGAGARLEDLPLEEDLELLLAAHRVITFVECAAYHHQRFAAHGTRLGPKARELIELGLVTPAVAYVQAQRLRPRFLRRIEPALRKVDAVLTAAAPGPAPRDLGTTGQPELNIPWTVCGFPALAVPSGRSPGGLPLAIQLAAPRHGEARLLAVGAWCERVVQGTSTVGSPGRVPEVSQPSAAGGGPGG